MRLMCEQTLRLLSEDWDKVLSTRGRLGCRRLGNSLLAKLYANEAVFP